MRKCFVIGNDNQYYGISGSRDDGPQVTIPDLSDGSKIISITRLLNPKKNRKNFTK